MSIRKTRPADVPFDGVILTEKEALDVQRKLFRQWEPVQDV